MCGISGFLDIACRYSNDELKQIATRMADTIRHRGPDDNGSWTDEQAGIALGFRRLSIIDLSPTGHQPMLSADGRYAVVFNGEIYNFESLRQSLEELGHTFRGTSDTEVMLAAFSQWGVEAGIKRLNGMFGIALWDRQEKKLYLIRDRLGIKPLYYGWVGSTFFFSSELKAIRAHPEFHSDINRDAVALYLRYNYIPTPYSIYQGFNKLLPGAILTINTQNLDREAEPVVYWSAKAVAEYGAANPFQGTAQEARDELDALLRESIQLRMIADVPLGAFLSGGVDSSAVVALMQAQSSRPVETFSIGFHEAGYNEAEYAKAVARHLGTKHTELYVTPQEARAVIPLLPSLYDEPFADSSQIPTYLVSELARRHVTVSLSGDGGDELFTGYNRYFWGRRLWNTIGWIPGWGKKAISKGLTQLSPERWNSLKKIIPAANRLPMFADKVQKLSEVFAADSPELMYLGFVSFWKNPADIVKNSHEPPTVLTDPKRWADLPSFMQRMMYMDLVSYLPDDILVKVDRASMGVSLEARVPYLDDHRVAEFAWRLPLSMKMRSGQSKWLLRQVLYKYIPRELIERPKMGFGVPIDTWMRGPLKDWAESLLNEQRLRDESIFDPLPIRQKWHEHIEGKRNWQYYLWGVLMFQAWLSETAGR